MDWASRRAMVLRIWVSGTSAKGYPVGDPGSGWYRGGCRRAAAAAQEPGPAFEIARDDATLGPGAGDRCQIDPPLGRHPTGER